MSEESREQSSRRRFAMRMQQPLPRSTVVDRVAFIIGAAAAVWLAVIIAMQGFRTWYAPLLLVPVWAIMAYLALPRLHKMLSDLYVPDYFFGRTRTADGLLGDPVNLGVDGSFEQLDRVMTEAGWSRAEEITAASTWKIIMSTLLRRSYPTAPVSPLFLFGRRHDVAYQQEVEGNPKQRHHVRFWHSPPGWLLPGGAHADWLGAGTYDTDVGLSLFTFQLTHRIDENTDVERDYVVSSAREADPAVMLRVLRDFTTGYHSRNGGGDRFITDGNLPILDVSEVDASEHPVDVTKPDGSVEDTLRRAPLSVVLGIAAIVLSILVSIFGTGDATDELLELEGIALDTEPAVIVVGAVIVAILILVAVVMLIQLFLALRVLRGGAPRSRIALVVLLTLSIVAVAVSYVAGDVPLQLDYTLLGATLSCGALLAYSSESAAHWARAPRSKRGAPTTDPFPVDG